MGFRKLGQPVHGARAVGLGVLALVGAGAACGGGNGGGGGNVPDAGAGTLGGNAQHAIHVLIKHKDGTTTPVAFGQGTEMASGSAKALFPQDTTTEGDAGPLLAPPTIDDPGNLIGSTAWALVSRAAQACGADSTIGPYFSAGYSWYGFVHRPGLPTECTTRLAIEQALVCVADKLADVGDAVGNVDWPATPELSGTDDPPEYTYGTGDAAAGLVSYDNFYSEWLIPPQADADRFIVRDLAIHTLAMIPVMDAYDDLLGATCATNFAKTAMGPATFDPTADATAFQTIFGYSLSSPPTATPVYPDFPPSAVAFVAADGTNNTPAIASSALAIEAQILRSGGRLLHDLIRRDVYSDMASASQGSAQAVDPSAGNAIAWGVSPTPAGFVTSSQPYGSISHAARVLLGRWEIGDADDFPGTSQPACEGVAALDLVSQAMGPDLSTRVNDLPITTSGEATASQLVDESGIVLTGCGRAQAGSNLRNVLADQLSVAQQLRDGLPIDVTTTNAVEVLYHNVLAPISDAEITFAFERALSTWLLLTNTTDTSGIGPGCAAVADTTLPLPAGLTALVPGATGSSGSPVAPSVQSLGGIVVQGGIPRSLIHTDPMARAGGLQEVSQCDEEADPQWDPWGRSDPTQVRTPYTLPTAVFQDAFHIGQAFERQLGQIETMSNVPSITGSTTVTSGASNNPEAVARGGLAEIRTWAGSTMIHSAFDGTNFQVQVAGIPYSELGLAAGAPVSTAVANNVFAFVYGPPWMAECAAGLISCGTNVVTQQVSTVAAATNSSIGGTSAAAFTMTVPMATTGFTPPTTVPATPQASHFYMVRRHDPSNTTGHGYVMGALRTIGVCTVHSFFGGKQACIGYNTNNTYSFVDAPMQRELVHDAIDLGKWVGAAAPALGDQSAAQTSGYCVDGVPRDLFVPLDNELINGGNTYEDSWQNYLSLAQQAAQTADTLGQDLINDDLAISEKEESASEALAGICGTFGELSTVTVQTNGTTTASADDPATASCLDEPTTDVVFLGSAPAGFPSSGDPTSWLQTNVLACPMNPPGTAGRSPLCDVSGRELTASALGTVKATSGITQPATPSFTSECSAMIGDTTGKTGIMASLYSGFTGTAFLNALGADSMSTDSFAALSVSLAMSVDLHNNWSVTYAGQTIMSSTDTGYWPACLNNSGCAALNTGTASQPSQNYVSAMAFNAAFRWCGQGGVFMTSPLGCDGMLAPAPVALASALPVPNEADAELNELKFRVTQALWMIAASAGELPARMFDVPMPVVDSTTHATPTAFPWALTYNGQLTRTGGSCSLSPVGGGSPYTCTCDSGNSLCGWVLNSNPSNPNASSSSDAVTMGTVYDVDPRFGAFTDHAINEIPTWYRTLYAQASGFKHALYMNGQQAFPGCDGRLGGPTGDSCALAGAKAMPLSLASLFGDRMSSADGLKCLNPWGEGSTTPPAVNISPGFAGGAWWQQVGYVTEDITYQGTMDVELNYPNFTGATWDWAPTTDIYPTIAISSALPWDRGLLVLGDGATVNGTCGALNLLFRAATFACASQTTSLASLTPESPPQINTPNDIIELQGWLGLTGQTVLQSANRLYAVNVPNRVITDFLSNSVGSGNLGGSKGAAILDMEQTIQSIPSLWNEIGSDILEIQNAMQAARLAMNAADLTEQATAGNLALQVIQVQGQMAQAAVGFLMTIQQAAQEEKGTWGASTGMIPIAALGLVKSLATGHQELNQLNSLTNVAQETEENQVAQALAALGQTTSPLWTDISTSTDNLRAAVAKLDADAQSVQLTQGQASYQAAIATGSDFVTIAGQEVPIAVDTVLRRQASATEQRYETALTNAKALAYMARLAIEQRIGTRMNNLKTPVGPLDAPSAWADDICTLQGVNYASLSTATVDGGGIGGTQDQQAISEYADAWVGDYVAKLQNFVTYYNAQYPSHQGSDTAVVSLRYDLMNPVSQCTAPAPNLLVSSSRMDELTPVGSPSGWQMNTCAAGSTSCMSVLTGGVLQAPASGPVGTANQSTTGNSATDVATGISWLVDFNVPAPSDAGVGGPQSDGGFGVYDSGAAAQGVPQGIVYQTVTLQPGSYVLSWWDQARDPNGNVLWAGGVGSDAGVTAPVNYVVRIYDGSWTSVASFDGPPFTPTQGVGSTSPTLWSSRRTLPLTVATTSVYRIAFASSLPGSTPGSVAIADPQLEVSSSGNPSAYVETDGSGAAPAYSCPMTESDFRAAFTHNCDANGVCSYDLKAPILIDTLAVSSDQGPIAMKLAPGNYNYRHDSVALNLVGTGVHDCSNDPTQSCYGSGYVQYSLVHDATNAGILDYTGAEQVFDFGTATINHGKALAAEQYLTMPLSSNDSALISQPGIEHEELGGRPLDGAYSLRIWDSQDLDWAALQDIQIVFNYEYWSAIEVSGNTGDVSHHVPQIGHRRTRPIVRRH